MLGRQEVWEVAQRRKHDIALFLDSLFGCEDAIAHSDLIYTFFHPLLRDQEEADIHIRKLKESKKHFNRDSSRRIQGELKLSLEYRKDTLYVMVCHAKNLLTASTASEDEPNSYVKVYLHPDPRKVTKRKTKVVRKNCHPSFMEMVSIKIVSFDLFAHLIQPVSVGVPNAVGRRQVQNVASDDLGLRPISRKRLSRRRHDQPRGRRPRKRNDEMV